MVKILPPGIKPLPLPPEAGAPPGVCQMRIGEKVVRVQKIVMSKAEVDAITKKGLVEIKACIISPSSHYEPELYLFFNNFYFRWTGRCYGVEGWCKVADEWGYQSDQDIFAEQYRWWKEPRDLVSRTFERSDCIRLVFIHLVFIHRCQDRRYTKADTLWRKLTVWRWKRLILIAKIRHKFFLRCMARRRSLRL